MYRVSAVETRGFLGVIRSVLRVQAVHSWNNLFGKTTVVKISSSVPEFILGKTNLVEKLKVRMHSGRSEVIRINHFEGITRSFLQRIAPIRQSMSENGPSHPERVRGFMFSLQFLD